MFDPHNFKPAEVDIDYNSQEPPMECLEFAINVDDHAYNSLSRSQQTACQLGNCAFKAVRCHNDEYEPKGGDCKYIKDMAFLHAI